MAKLNTYQLQSQLAATLQLIGIIPGAGSTFETVRLSNAALVAFVEQYAGTDGTNGKEVELRQGTTHIEWRYAGDIAWKQLIAISELKGPAGEKIMLQKSSTAIQWKYESASSWTDLVQLTELKGTNGTNGRTMWAVTAAPSPALGVDGDFANDPTNSMMYGPKTAGVWGVGISYKGVKGDAGTGLKNRGAWVTGTTYNPGDYVFSTGSATASSMWILNGETPYVSNTLPKDDAAKWVEFVAPAGEDGKDGKNVEMRKTATVIQWRLVGDPDWIDLVTLNDIKGTDGGDGTNGKTMLSTTGAPAASLGVQGDFANDVTNSVMYGPKGASTWPAGVSYKGGKGNDGTNGARWHVGAPVPDAGLGALGDFYLRDNGDVYGPKAGGGWGAVVAVLKGTKGDAGPGVPAGGTVGQALVKKSATDFDTEWKTISSGGGGGLPAGGAINAVLMKKTADDGDVVWGRTLVGGNPPAGDFTGYTGIAEKVVFTGEVGIAGMQYFPTMTKLTVASGKVLLNYGTPGQMIDIAAVTAAMEITLPSEALNGHELTILVPFEITAVTWVGGSKWGQPVKLYGFPATLKPGMYRIRFYAADVISWFMAQ